MQHPTIEVATLAWLGKQVDRQGRGSSPVVIENTTLVWLEGLGCAVKCGPEIAPGAGRSDPNYRDGAQAGRGMWRNVDRY